MHLKFCSYLAAAAFTFGTAAPSLADTWNVDPDRSKLGFEVQQGQGTVQGTFETWTATIEFDPQKPEDARISARIEPASASTGNAQFDGTIPSKDWFDVDGFPVVEFKADGAQKIDGTSYKADGVLTIKGVTQPITLEFTLDFDGDTAKADGTAKLNRLDYKLGEGVGSDTVSDAVTVTLDLTAVR